MIWSAGPDTQFETGVPNNPDKQHDFANLIASNNWQVIEKSCSRTLGGPHSIAWLTGRLSLPTHRILLAADEEPSCPREPTDQPSHDLASNLADLPPRDFSGNCARRRAREYGHQEYEQPGITDPSQDCTNRRADDTSNRNCD